MIKLKKNNYDFNNDNNNNYFDFTNTKNNEKNSDKSNDPLNQIFGNNIEDHNKQSIKK